MSKKKGLFWILGVSADAAEAVATAGVISAVGGTNVGEWSVGGDGLLGLDLVSTVGSLDFFFLDIDSDGAVAVAMADG